MEAEAEEATPHAGFLFMAIRTLSSDVAALPITIRRQYTEEEQREVE